MRGTLHAALVHSALLPVRSIGTAVIHARRRRQYLQSRPSRQHVPLAGCNVVNPSKPMA
ncbi:hypothetical protein [Cupriavidus nantongensis]|uniref:hypothetical protein n=1 Tax=Cupriavidus nantongensis TaxID=1796606 RepID=UPI000A8C3CC1|nr:hypothetical protein [Cupriavidus nantongensis]